jgi:hypothetical protein
MIEVTVDNRSKNNSLTGNKRLEQVQPSRTIQGLFNYLLPILADFKYFWIALGYYAEKAALL